MKNTLIAAVLSAIAIVNSYASVLAPDGRPYKQIVLAEGQATSVQLAAREMQSFLKQICGDELPIVQKASEFPAILIGACEEAKAHGLDGNKLPAEGWAVKTGKDFLAIYGQDYNGPNLEGRINPWRWIEAYNPDIKLNAFGASGTLTAVYEFLHRVAGVRFYMPGPDGTVVPNIPEFKIPELSLESAPRVSWRWIWTCFLYKDKEAALWSKRVGIGGKAPVQIIHSYNFMQKYKDTHPEYFALADGKRAFDSECVAIGGGHLCLTNPGLIQQWADDICEYFAKNPEVDVYPLAPNDGLSRICECPNCQADLTPGRPSDEAFSLHIWKFTAKVAEKVAEKYPDKYVGCLAYEQYRTPPREMGHMKNVAVMFCNGRSRLENPETREQLHKEILEWNKRADRIYLWCWYLDHWMPWKYLPVVQMRNIQRELGWLYKNTAFQGEFIEAEGQHWDHNSIQSPAMQHLGLYMTGRMYMDPDSDADAILKEYAKLFYGPAEKPMFAFWNGAQLAREKLMATKSNIQPDELFTPALISELKKCIDDAVAATEDGSVYRRRVMAIKAEFDQGASRLTRLESSGNRKAELAIINGFEDLDEAVGDKFCGKDGAVFSPATWLYMGRDRKLLYLRFLCYDEDMSALQEKTHENDDGNIWTDDSVEVHLFPDENNLKHGYQIIVSTAGVVFDRTVFSAIEGDTKWQSNLTADIRKESNRWIADIRIPFASFDIPDPNFAGHIKANFYRNRSRDGGFTESSCWSPTGLEYHVCPEKFGVLIPAK